MGGGMGGGGLGDVSAVPSDLEAIYQGGAFFLDRMKAMSAAKDAADQALALFNLGNDIVAAHAAAIADAFAAASDRERATSLLATANEDASRIISQAKSSSSDIAANTVLEAGYAKAAADKLRSDADDYAAKIKAEVDVMRAEAETIRHDLVTLRDGLQAAQDLADAAAAEAEKAKAQSAGRQALYVAKIKALHAAIDSVAAISQ